MSLCDSLQVIGHCGLRTKIEERKRSRWENMILMLKPFIFFLGVQIWYLETDVKAKLAFIFRYAGKDKLFHDLNSASYITKIRRKQCRWDPSSCFNCGLWCVSSQWRLGKRHPGLQALFLSNCSSTISDQDVCRSEDHLIIVRLQPRVIVLLSWFDGCIALALPWTHSTQARLLLPLPGRAGHRPEHIADRLLPFLSCQVTVLKQCQTIATEDEILSIQEPDRVGKHWCERLHKVSLHLYFCPGQPRILFTSTSNNCFCLCPG